VNDLSLRKCLETKVDIFIAGWVKWRRCVSISK